MIQEISIGLQFSRMGKAFLINLSFIPIVLVIGFVVGILVALIRYYKVIGLSQVFVSIIEIIRAAPFLLLVYAVYFILPYTGISLSAYNSGVMVLSLTASAFFSEIFLSGLRAIDSGQYQAADALGMTFIQKFWKIILPQIWRMTLPSIVGQIVMIIKDTTIISLIGLSDVMRTSRQISLLTLNPFISFGIVAFYFFIVCFPLIMASKKLERKLEVSK